VPATLVVELTMFAAGVLLYLGLKKRAVDGAPRGGIAFWLFAGFLVVAYFAAAFGPPPPNVRALAFSALAMWLLIPWAWWLDRDAPAGPRS
jgi:hypothetical protein